MRQKGEKLGSNGHYLIDPWAAANMNQATEHSLTTLPAARPWPGANQLRAPPLLPVLICNQTASKSSKAGKFENNKQLKRQILCDAALTFFWPYKLHSHLPEHSLSLHCDPKLEILLPTTPPQRPAQAGAAGSFCTDLHKNDSYISCYKWNCCSRPKRSLQGS